jgi:peptide/nickel transport system permease protein
VGLEFLGIGDVSVVTWGTNLYWASNNAALLTGAWWTVVPTGMCVALIGFALVLVNFAIDEITNPRLRAERTWTRLLRSHKLEGGLSTPVVRR